MNQVGSYLGVKWSRQPLSDVFPHTNQRTPWYIITETGDHFRTLRELMDRVDSHPELMPERSGGTIATYRMKLSR